MDLQPSCPHCSKEYSESNLPKLLALCGHTYCQKCLTSMATLHESGKQQIICPEDSSQIIFQQISSLPKNLALISLIQAKKNNSSERSINSLKDQSFNVPKINRSYQEDDDDQELITAIDGNKQQSSTEEKSNILEAVQVQQKDNKTSESESQSCLLHNKPIQLVCLVDHQWLCSKCAIFGQHKGHQFVSLEQIEQGNKRYYESLLNIFEEKAIIVERLSKKETQNALIEVLNAKNNKLRKEIGDKFKKLADQVAKAEKAAYNKLNETIGQLQQRLKKLLVVDQTAVDSYHNWEVNSLQKFNENESGTHEGVLNFYLSGSDLIQKGKEIINKLKMQQEIALSEADKFIQELGVNFNEGPCILSLATIVQIYDHERQYEKKTVAPCAKQKQNQHIFSNFSQQDFKKRVKTETFHDDDESLLQIGDDYDDDKSISNSVISSSFLNESMIKKTNQRQTLKTTKNITKITPRKKLLSSFISKDAKQERVKQQKPKQQRPRQTPLTRDGIKKKLKGIKVPQKYEKILEGILNDSLETVDLTGAQLGDNIILQICQLMRNNTKSRTLKLIRNKITDDGLLKLLPLVKGTITLNLSQNVLTDNCLNALSDMRGILPNLKSVILSQNKINQRKSKPAIQKLRSMNLVITI